MRISAENADLTIYDLWLEKMTAIRIMKYDVKNVGLNYPLGPIRWAVAYSHVVKMRRGTGYLIAVGRSGTPKLKRWNKKSPPFLGDLVSLICKNESYKYSRDTYNPYCSLEPIDSGDADRATLHVW